MSFCPNCGEGLQGIYIYNSYAMINVFSLACKNPKLIVNQKFHFIKTEYSQSLNVGPFELELSGDCLSILKIYKDNSPKEIITTNGSNIDFANDISIEYIENLIMLS